MRFQFLLTILSPMVISNYRNVYYVLMDVRFLSWSNTGPKEKFLIHTWEINLDFPNSINLILRILVPGPDTKFKR